MFMSAGELLSGMQLLFGPIPGGGESLLMVVLGGLLVLVQLLLLYSWLRSLGRIPAAFEEGYRSVAGDGDGDDVVSFWRYLVPVVGAELLVVAVLRPSAVDSLYGAVAATVALLFGTLVLAGAVASTYLVVRRFEDGFRSAAGESASTGDAAPRRYVRWVVGLAVSLAVATVYLVETNVGLPAPIATAAFGVVVFVVALVAVALVAALGVLAVRRFREGYRRASES